MEMSLEPKGQAAAITEQPMALTGIDTSSQTNSKTHIHATIH